MTFKKLLIAAIIPAMMTGAIAKDFKISLGDALGGTQGKMGETFAELLKEKSGGKHTGVLFPNGQLGSEQDTVNSASMGTLDFSVVALPNVGPFSPSVNVLTLPYVIQSSEDAKTILEGEIGEELIKNTLRDANVRIIGWAYSGFRVLTNNKKPVKTVADLKGLVIRVPKNEIMLNTYKSWGINATPMAWSETFTALQQGVVDGQDNPYITVAAMKFDDIQKYITNLRYLYSIEPLLVSETVFQAQSKEDQAMILAAGKEATAISYKYLQDTEAGIKAKFKEKGIIINEPADGEKEFIKLATEAVWPKSYKKIGGKENLDKVLKALGR